MSKPPDRQSTPSFREFVERRIDARLARVRTSLPAEVLSYDHETATVSAQPLIDQGDVAEDGERVVRRLPVVTDVPVVYFGGDGNRDTFPLKAGDLVLLVFASSSIARWKVTGKGGDPGDDRHHSINDGFALPLSRGPAHESARVIEGADIRLGSSSASQAVTCTNDVEAAIKGALSDEGVAGAIAAVGVGGTAPIVAALTAYFTANPVSGAAKVKAE